MPAVTGLPHRGKSAPGGNFQQHFPKPGSSYSPPTTPVQALLGGGGAPAPVEANQGITQATGVKFINTVRSADHPAGSPGYLIDLPSYRVGDLVLIHVGVSTNNLNLDTTMVISGWTQLAAQRRDLKYDFIFYRIIDGTEGATVLSTMGGTTPELNTASAAATSYRNVDATNPVSAAVVGGSTNSASSSFTTSPITTPDSGDLVLLLTTTDATGTTTVSTPTGTTSRYDFIGFGQHLSLKERLFPSGSFTFSATLGGNGEYNYCVVALRPAANAGGGISGTHQIEASKPIVRTKDSTAYTKKELAQNPYLYYHLDEDGSDPYLVAVDASGNGRDGLYVGTFTYNVAPLIQGGSAVTFDGTSAHILGPQVTVPAGNKIRLKAWIKTTAGGTQTIWGNYDNQATRFFALQVAAGKLLLTLADSGQGAHQRTGAITVNDGAAHLVEATYDGATLRLYVDGNEDGTGTADVFTLQAGAGTTYVGVQRTSLAFSSRFNGTIDEPEIFFTVDATTPGKIKQGFLDATGTLPNVVLESLAPVSATGGVDRIESNQGIAATGQDPLEANQGIAATAAERLEALQLLAVSGPTVAEALVALNATAAERLEAGQAIAATRDDPLEARGRITSSASSPAETLAPLSKTAQDALEALVALNATAAGRLEAGQAIAATGSDPLEARGLTTSSASGSVETLGTLSKSAQEALEALVGLSATSSGQLDILTGLRATLATALETLLQARATAGGAAEAGATTAANSADALEAAAGLITTTLAPAETIATLTASIATTAEILATARRTSGELPIEWEFVAFVLGIVLLSGAAGATVQLLGDAAANVALSAAAGAHVDLAGDSAGIATIDGAPGGSVELAAD